MCIRDSGRPALRACNYGPEHVDVHNLLNVIAEAKTRRGKTTPKYAVFVKARGRHSLT